MSKPNFKIVVELTNSDPATACWTAVAEQFLDEKYEGFEYVALKGNDCIPEKVYDALRDPSAIGVSGLSVGHGSDCETTVQNMIPDFSCGNPNNILLRGKYFNKCTCLYGKGGLPDLVNNYGLGCGCGEVTEYWIVTNKTGKKWQDPVTYFIDANFEFDRQLMQGKTAKEAYDAMIAKYKQHAEYWKDKDPETARLLNYDADNRPFFGDPNWAVGNIPPPPPTEPHLVEASAESSKDPYMRYFYIKVNGVPEHVETGWFKFYVKRTIYLPKDKEADICISVSADETFGWEGTLKIDDKKPVSGACDKNHPLCVHISGQPPSPPQPPQPPQPPPPPGQKYSGEYTTNVVSNQPCVVQAILRLKLTTNKDIEIPMTIDLRNLQLLGEGKGSESGTIQDNQYSGDAKGDLSIKIDNQYPIVLWFGNIPKKGFLIIKSPQTFSFIQLSKEQGKVE
ncbi:hypothetical protein [Candidatus Methanodesulfokora washburnensis]|uniref:Uncharacterized protein n=1 Tax=Candidatus Methanodesulfokora washburnensis TaxID=2478471 RepID=A0A3R9X135_9CREN|nr:hypothetical protein [Candidatus Methanodesulfokores washburnensis]RSN72700.1 hypothetical protein D6D85_12725 [Candidatus Methanodesulfokores washburnensis]